MKYQILSEIIDRLSELGLSLQYGNSTDITISTEFIDAGWSTGNKRILYEALIFANEQYNVVYMYEKTTETGSGLSFGGEAETMFQTGRTLYRKVKSIKYSPDGKTYEYDIDLRAILKAVKVAAKLYGWRFETVIKKNKAKYPAGYVPMFFNSALQVHAPPQNGYPLRMFYGGETLKKGRRPGGVIRLFGYILLGIILILMLMYVTVSH